MLLASAARQVPITSTDIGSSLLDTALKATIRNMMPSPDRPGSTSRAMGARNESTNKNTETASRNMFLHVQRLCAHLGRAISCHAPAFFMGRLGSLLLY